MAMGLNDERVTEVLSWGLNFAAVSVDTMQRLAVLVANIVLIFLAFGAIWADRGSFCGEALHLYSGVCVFLLSLDTLFELIRCSKENRLDRLQSHSWATGQGGTSNLLSCDDSVGQVRLPPVVAGSRRSEHSAASPWQLVGQEKSSVQRRLADLQRLSFFFTCIVAVLFSFLSAHDLDCSMNSPNLYNYIHNFAYVFILRLGLSIITFCCRTIKDYEDEAATSEAMGLEGGEMRKF